MPFSGEMSLHLLIDSTDMAVTTVSHSSSLGLPVSPRELSLLPLSGGANLHAKSKLTKPIRDSKAKKVNFKASPALKPTRLQAAVAPNPPANPRRVTHSSRNITHVNAFLFAGRLFVCSCVIRLDLM